MVHGCPERVAPTMWRSHLNQHASGLFPGNVPSDWLTQNGFFVCHLCHQLVSESHVALHNKKCKGSTLTQPCVPIGDHSDVTPDHACAEATYLPSLDEIFALKVSTLTHIPCKSLPIFAQTLSSALRAVVHENTEEAWRKLLMLPKCCLPASKRSGRHHKPLDLTNLCDLWTRGQYGVLWHMATKRSTPTPPTAHGSVKSRKHIDSAISFAPKGSKACQHLVSSGIAPNSPDTTIQASQRSHSFPSSCSI